MWNCTSFESRRRSYSSSERRSPLRAHDSISNSSSSPFDARNSICPASRCPASVTSRNDRGVMLATRTGPSHGPGIRTTNSSFTRSLPSSPRSFWKVANSLGAALSGSCITCSASSSAESSEPSIRTL